VARSISLMNIADRCASPSSTYTRGLALRSSNSNSPPRRARSFRTWSATVVRHDFAIWRLETGTLSRQPVHIYFCLRCSWTFTVDDCTGSVTALDQEGRELVGAAAAERLATFSAGPCPASTRLTADLRLTHRINATEQFYLRLIVFAASIYKALGIRLGRQSPDSIRQAS
jgi:hypothetical protein